MSTQVNGQPVETTVPEGAFPGSSIQFQMPAAPQVAMAPALPSSPFDAMVNAQMYP